MTTLLRQHGLDSLGLALLAAFVLHAALILGVSFDINRVLPPPPERTLDITVVRPTESEAPEDPTMLAQHAQQGGAEQVGDSRAASPATRHATRPKPSLTPEQRRATTPQPEPHPEKPTLTAQHAEQQVEVRPARPPLPSLTTPDAAQLLASTQQEIDRLAAVMDQRSFSASRHERRKAVNASTQEYLPASYLDAWRRKVENIGNLNYPDEAKRRHLYGNLLLHVAVRSDGSLESVRLVRSSGHKILDDAAIRIVRLAAPYAPFPAELRQEVDVLDITRTWVFQRNNQLSSGR